MVFASELFTDTDGVALSTHDANWNSHISYTGAMEILANRGINSDANPALFYRSETPSNANYIVSTDLYVVSDAGYQGVVGRIDTVTETFYMARYFQIAGAWQLYKFVSGVATQLGTNYVQSLSVASTYNVALKMDADQISLFVNSVERIGPITDTAITAAGKAGIRGRGGVAGAGYHYDNFSAALISTPKVSRAAKMILGI